MCSPIAYPTRVVHETCHGATIETPPVHGTVHGVSYKNIPWHTHGRFRFMECAVVHVTCTMGPTIGNAVAVSVKLVVSDHGSVLWAIGHIPWNYLFCGLTHG